MEIQISFTTDTATRRIIKKMRSQCQLFISNISNRYIRLLVTVEENLLHNSPWDHVGTHRFQWCCVIDFIPRNSTCVRTEAAPFTTSQLSRSLRLNDAGEKLGTGWFSLWRWHHVLEERIFVQLTRNSCLIVPRVTGSINEDSNHFKGSLFFSFLNLISQKFSILFQR